MNISLNKKTILRDDFPRGARYVAFNIPAGDHVEPLSEDEFNLLKQAIYPLDYHRFVEEFARINRITSTEESQRTILSRFINKNIIDLCKTNEVVDIDSQPHLAKGIPASNGVMPQRSPSHVYIETTQICNLKCLHCFSCETTDQYTLDRALVDRIFTELEQAGVLSVTISGGEPSIHPNFLHILDLLAQSRFGATILTNGMDSWTKEALDKVIQLQKVHNRGITLSISLDATDENIHDRIRGRSQASKKTLSTINYLAEHGFTNISLQMVLLNINFREMDKVVQFAADRGLKKVVFSNLLSIGNGKHCQPYMLSREEEEFCLYKSLELRQKYKNVIDIVLPKNASHFSDILNSTTSSTRSNPTCMAGMEEVAIRADGHVFPCAYLWDKDYALGNIAVHSLTEIWNHPRMKFFRGGYSVEDLDLCSGCAHANKCKLLACRALPIIEGNPYGCPPNCGLYQPVADGGR